ncbi:MAG: hypothetical protein Q9178_001430 [Gyalolechia marmorata]
MAGLLAKAIAHRRARLVGPSEVTFQTLSGSVNALGAASLPAGCLIVIASGSGAIMAHIAASPSFIDAHVGPMMANLASLYKANRAACFPSINETWVFIGSISELNGQKSKLEDDIMIIREKLAAVGLVERVEEAYKFELRNDDKSPTNSSKGTVLVTAEGHQLEIYVEDQRISLV